MIRKWAEFSLRDKLIAILSVLLSVAVIVLALLQILDVWNRAIHVTVPLMGLNLLCQAWLQWRTSRRVAYFSIGAAVFVFICAIAVFFLK